MKLLISFCNTYGYSYIKKNNISPLVLLDTSKNIFKWIHLPIKKSFVGLTGICSSNERIFVLSQQSKYCVIYIIDRSTLKCLNRQRLFKVVDPHSIIYEKNSLYIVSTGNNSIVEYRLQRNKLINPKIIYKYKDTKSNIDLIHINSINKSTQGIIFSAFGNKTGKLKKTAKNGYIYSQNLNKKIISPIFHPHSVTEFNNEIYYCESAKSNVSKEGQIIIQLSRGYTRGLIATNKGIYFGTSSSRAISKSTGVKNTDIINDDQNNCRLIQIKKNIFGFNNYKVYNFSKYFKEIYDLLEIDCPNIKLPNKIKLESIFGLIKFCKNSFK